MRVLLRSAIAVTASTLICVISSKATAQDATARSAASIESSPLVQALRTELARASQLRMEGAGPPHYVAYGVIDVDQVDVVAEFGGIVQDERSRERYLRVDVRVGTPEFDSSNTADQGFFVAQLPVDDDAVALRRDLWWTTDRAYKAAVEALETKRAEAMGTLGGERVSDFSDDRPLRTVVEREVRLPEAERLRELARRLSEQMRDSSAVIEGGVRLRAVRTARTFVSSDGGFGYEPALFIQWAAIARTQSDDGMNLIHHDTGIVRSEAELPSEDELAQRVRTVVRELEALRVAPAAEAYVGPVIFEGSAAGALLRTLVVPHITGTPEPSSGGVRSAEPASGVPGRSSTFARRVGKRVAPTWLSLYDDPRPSSAQDSLRVGAYAFDDEGLRPRRVPLIDEGRFTGFLMSRTPARGFLHSSGHGRGALLSPRAQIGHLVLASREQRTRAQLYARALREAQAAGESYALVVRRIDDGSITDAYRGVELAASSDPMLYAVRIRADGSEEPVRGLSLVTDDPRALRDLLATDDAPATYSYFASTFDPSGAGYWDSFPLYAVGASIQSPSLLFEEIELRLNPTLRTARPVVSPPSSSVRTRSR